MVKLRIRHFYILIIFLISCHLFLLFVLITPEEEVKGWGYNHIRNISYYISPKTNHISQYCCLYKTILLVIVHSKPSNIDERNAIRETWGLKKNFPKYNVSLFFLLGQTKNKLLEKMIMSEKLIHKDIIQENFIDRYNNLTLKSVAMLKFFTQCGRFMYLLKCNDDTYVNLPEIIKMLKLISRWTTNNMLIGRLMVDTERVTDPRSKYYSSRYMYNGDVYPKFLSGAAYLMSLDIGFRLYKTALATPLFHLEDVFITGICALEAGIKCRDDSKFTICNVPNNVCFLLKLYTAHSFNPEKMRNVYRSLYYLNKTCTLLGKLDEFGPDWLLNFVVRNKMFEMETS